MRIEAVIICRNYGDFLRETLARNVGVLDHIVVVTRYDDHETKAVCSHFSVECVEAHGWDEDGPFSKGRMINIGLSHLRNPDWILHIDADVVLPSQFRQMLARAQLNPDNLYGCDRVNVFGWEAWQAIKAEGRHCYRDRYFVEMPSAPTARLIHSDYGYCPIGFFQLWHKSVGNKYPLGQGTAEHTDLLFAIKWHRAQRVLLPEIWVYHLDSLPGPAPMGANWNGRKTPVFGPCKPEQPGKPYGRPT